MRRLTSDELADIAGEVGADASVDVAELVAVQDRGDELGGVMAQLLVAIVGGRPFARRNDAVGIVAVDLLARVNGQVLDLEPPEETVAVIAAIRDGLAFGSVHRWLVERLAPRAVVAGPRCPACSMPMRESFAVGRAGRFGVPSCGGCGQVLGRPFPHRRLQEV